MTAAVYGVGVGFVVPPASNEAANDSGGLHAHVLQATHPCMSLCLQSTGTFPCVVCGDQQVPCSAWSYAALYLSLHSVGIQGTRQCPRPIAGLLSGKPLRSR